MSRGSFFILLRENNTINDNELLLFKQSYLNKINENSYEKYTLDNFNFNQFICLDDYIYIDTINKIKYTELFNLHFISTFSYLKEYWNMSEFNNNPQKVINTNIAKLLLQAIDYILSENYNKQFENILNNQYVNVLASDYPPYYKFVHNENSYNNEDEFWENETISHLTRMKIIINTFLEIKDDYKLKLIYEVYG